MDQAALITFALSFAAVYFDGRKSQKPLLAWQWLLSKDAGKGAYVIKLFEDCGEIDHVIDLIEEQRNDAKRGLYEMRTARHLAELLRNELLGDGITTPGDIVDANEIVFWYLDKKVSPDMWQYVFAECLAELMIFFDEPLGTTNDVYERLERRNQLDDLRDKCVKVLHADQSRIRAENIEKLAPLAETAVKVTNGGRKGHIATYGDEESKKTARKQWQDWIDDEIKINPRASFEAIKKNVAKRNQVSVHQLKRYTHDSRKKT